MPIAFGSADFFGESTASSWTKSFTTAGVDRLLVVVGHQSGTITTVTYNSVGMTRLTAVGDVDFWYLINPASGANNIVATDSGSHFVRFACAYYTGVNQVTPLNVQGTFSPGTVSTITATLTTTVANCWMMMVDRGAGTQTAGANTTLRARPGNDGQEGYFDSNGDRAAGSNSLTASGTSGTYYAIAAAFAPVAGNDRTLLGVGK
jgi:hypothetical protein